MPSMKYIIDYGIIGVLVLMSILAVAVYIERLRTFRKIVPADYKTVQAYEAVLTKRMYIVATVGSNAPYVGLLGTVLGIMHTFYAIGAKGTTDVNMIMTGLALSLKATAAGLVTAIPAIILYNILNRRANELILLKEAENEGETV
ncbi:tonB-system energizer ExbB [Denitrovibrio acetiphilus DSM 12809]|uniref:TonB-system energizer ExbB n=1 Tax=Denitrovibrio acetiphilus (strain DSM 12809 / NBRC 114555 / N2460) TaxID=522772 RepID=D4H649_DENA2|nr:TonB-system energizer ExbB [Denitrovibrio acetiphilus]ADD67695.1 tonB-system energizer ExbB [Denitrovibrio acetiphilus DSM 12809]